MQPQILTGRSITSQPNDRAASCVNQVRKLLVVYQSSGLKASSTVISGGIIEEGAA